MAHAYMDGMAQGTFYTIKIKHYGTHKDKNAPRHGIPYTTATRRIADHDGGGAIRLAVAVHPHTDSGGMAHTE